MASRGRADADAAQRPPRVRLTGFGKFRGVPDNPTLRLVHALPASLAKEPIPGLAAEDVEFEVLETSADAVQSYLTRCVSEHAAAGDRPLLLLHFGVFEGSDAFRIETCGYNEADFRVADERGFMPRKERISEGEPSGAALRTAVPVEALVSRLAARQHIPVVASDNPGRFVCNYLLYSSLHATRGLSPPATALFVHVPGHGTAPHEDQVAFARLVLQELIALHHAPTSQCPWVLPARAPINCTRHSRTRACAAHGAEQGDAGPLPDGGGSAAAMSDPGPSRTRPPIGRHEGAHQLVPPPSPPLAAHVQTASCARAARTARATQQLRQSKPRRRGQPPGTQATTPTSPSPWLCPWKPTAATRRSSRRGRRAARRARRREWAHSFAACRTLCSRPAAMPRRRAPAHIPSPASQPQRLHVSAPQNGHSRAGRPQNGAGQNCRAVLPR